jgi:hypothetical protein
MGEWSGFVLLVQPWRPPPSHKQQKDFTPMWDKKSALGFPRTQEATLTRYPVHSRP